MPETLLSATKMSLFGNTTVDDIENAIDGLTPRNESWSNATCLVTPPVNDTNPRIFQGSRSIRRGHNWPPRFGRTSNITAALVGEDTSDYVVGVVASSMLIFAFITAWVLTLILFKCCGRNRVGFLSGQRVKKPVPPPGFDENDLSLNEEKEYDEDGAEDTSATASPVKTSTELVTSQPRKPEAPVYTAPYGETPPASGVVQEVEMDGEEDHNEAFEDYRTAMSRYEARVFRIRFLVVLTTMGIMVCAILMTVIGVESLRKSVSNGSSALSEGERLAQEAIGLVDEFLILQEDARNETTNFVAAMNGFCPGVREQICDDMENLVGCDFTGIPYEEDIRNVIDGVRVRTILPHCDLRS